MSSLQEVENSIAKFSASDIKEFRNWYGDFDAQSWDEQFTSDVKSGKLNNLAKMAIADFKANKCKET